MENLKAEHRMFGFKNLIIARRYGAKGCGKEWLAPLLFQGSCNAQLLETGVEQCLMKELHGPAIVVMDNASLHNHKRVSGCSAQRAS